MFGFHRNRPVIGIQRKIIKVDPSLERDKSYTRSPPVVTKSLVLQKPSHVPQPGGNEMLNIAFQVENEYIHRIGLLQGELASTRDMLLMQQGHCAVMTDKIARLEESFNKLTAHETYNIFTREKMIQLEQQLKNIENVQEQSETWSRQHFRHLERDLEDSVKTLEQGVHRALTSVRTEISTQIEAKQSNLYASTPDNVCARLLSSNNSSPSNDVISTLIDRLQTM